MNTRDLRFRSNRVGDILALFHEELDGMYGVGEVHTFVEMLFEAFLGWDRVQLLTGKDRTIDQSDLLRFHWALEDLHCQRPIQHIIGHTDFCGCRIGVSPDVLIPRPETEEMVQWIVDNGKLEADGGRLLDLCTGSGCIAIALKRTFPQAEVTAVDVSEKALAIARENAKANGAEVDFLQADVLAPTFQLPPSGFHLMVSNPPYVRESERVMMQRNVLDYEPAIALFVPDDDPLRFYRAIAEVAIRYLASDGWLVVEINEVLAEATQALLHSQGFEASVYSDFRGKPRWIAATFLNNK